MKNKIKNALLSLAFLAGTSPIGFAMEYPAPEKVIKGLSQMEKLEPFDVIKDVPGFVMIKISNLHNACPNYGFGKNAPKKLTFISHSSCAYDIGKYCNVLCYQTDENVKLYIGKQKK